MPDFHRRSLLASTSLAWFFGQNAEAASELAAKADAAPVDPPPPTGADLGSLFPALSQLTENRTFDLSYPSDRFRNVDEFRAAGRAAIGSFRLYGLIIDLRHVLSLRSHRRFEICSESHRIQTIAFGV